MTFHDREGPEVRNAKLVLCRYEYRKQCREGAKCTYAHSLQEVRPPPSGLLRSFPSTRYHYWDPKDPSGPPMPKIFTVPLDDPAFVAVAHWAAKALMEGSDVPEWCQNMLQAGVAQGIIDQDWRKWASVSRSRGYRLGSSARPTSSREGRSSRLAETQRSMSSSEDVLLSESVLQSPSPEAQPTTAPKASSVVILETLNSQPDTMAIINETLHQPDTMAIINETHRHCHDRSDATFSARAAWIQAQEPAPRTNLKVQPNLKVPPKVPPKAPPDTRLGRRGRDPHPN